MPDLTGRAIGIGLPLAAGAAIARPGREVIRLQAGAAAPIPVKHGTPARGRLDVLAVIRANGRCNIPPARLRGGCRGWTIRPGGWPDSRRCGRKPRPAPDRDVDPKIIYYS